MEHISAIDFSKSLPSTRLPRRYRPELRDLSILSVYQPYQNAHCGRSGDGGMLRAHWPAFEAPYYLQRRKFTTSAHLEGVVGCQKPCRSCFTALHHFPSLG